jgi:L-arabinose isomerase
MAIERRKPLTAKVGILSVGHHTYWGQFPGLLDEMNRKTKVLVEKVTGFGVEAIDFGMVDNAETAYAALPKVRAAGIDLLMIDMVTYATSSTFGVFARELKDLPMVLIALQPRRAMDYKNATTYMQLCNDDFCSVPEFTGVAIRMGRKPPHMVLGVLEGDAEADAEVRDWCDVAKVLHDLKGARIGQMGHVLESMLDMNSDPTMYTAAFGVHIVQTEPDDVMRHYNKVTDAAIDKRKKAIADFFDMPDPQVDPLTSKVTEEDLTTAAKVTEALEGFIAEKKLDGLAYYYEGQPDSEMRKVVTNFIVGNSLLTAAGFPMCGEWDLKTCVAMLIMDRLQMGGSFAEFHPVDFAEGFVLVGHDGPHHLNIADGKPVLRSLKTYHGKPGHGASVEFQLKHGPITMLSIGQTGDGRFKFIVGEGESVRGLIPATGNTNTRGFFKPDVKTFLKRWVAEGPTHHFALGLGHRAETIKKVAECLGIECAVVRTD